MECIHYIQSFSCNSVIYTLFQCNISIIPNFFMLIQWFIPYFNGIYPSYPKFSCNSVIYTLFQLNEPIISNVFSCKFSDLYLISMEYINHTQSFHVNSIIYTWNVWNILSLVVNYQIYTLFQLNVSHYTQSFHVNVNIYIQM